MPNDALKIANRLRNLATDIETTAHGSSRVAMYQDIAKAVREEAENVALFANVGNVEFRATTK
jgi:hypothetical protein